MRGCDEVLLRRRLEVLLLHGRSHARRWCREVRCSSHRRRNVRRRCGRSRVLNGRRGRSRVLNGCRGRGAVWILFFLRRSIRHECRRHEHRQDQRKRRTGAELAVTCV